MPTVLVTGAAGFLGSAVTASLLARGDRVVAVVRDRSPRSRLYADGLIERCVEVRAELSDAERLISQYRPQAVLHLAAQTQVTLASSDPVPTFVSNIQGTWALLEACRRASHPPQAVVVASSDKAYGTSPPPYREHTPLRPVAPYDVSKACADLIACSYGQHFGLPVAVTRCGNLYGPGDLNTRRLVPGVCADLAAGRPPALRSTGRMSREWLHIDDAAAATLAVLAAAPEHRGQAFNIGGGERASVADIVGRLCALAGYRAPLNFAPADPADEIPHQSLDSTALAALGWAAQVRLEAGLAASWAWYQAHPG